MAYIQIGFNDGFEFVAQEFKKFCARHDIRCIEQSELEFGVYQATGLDFYNSGRVDLNFRHGLYFKLENSNWLADYDIDFDIVDKVDDYEQ